jgi:hypothetical protein
MTVTELKAKCDNLRRWMNFFVLVAPMEKFPESIIE